MRTDDNNNRHLIADEGKVLRRISDGWVAGSEIYLGYTYYLHGEPLAEPLWELPEHYEEIDEIILEEIPDESFDTEIEVLIEPATSLMMLPESIPEQQEPTQVKLSELLVKALNDIEGLKQQVAELQKEK